MAALSLLSQGCIAAQTALDLIRVAHNTTDLVRLIGVLIVDSLSVIQARTDAAVRGADQGADFAEGHELVTAASALISASAVDRMLSPEEATIILSAGGDQAGFPHRA